MRSGSSTVHTLTAMPRAWRSATSSGVTARSWGWRTRWPWSHAVAATSRVSIKGRVRSAVGMASSTVRTRSTDTRSNDDTSTRSRQPPSPTCSATVAATQRLSSKSGSSGELFTSMLTTIPAQASIASSRVGTHGGRASRRTSRTGPRPGSEASWWTTRTSSRVRRTSSSTMSAPSRRASTNASTVFSLLTADAPRWAMTAVVALNAGRRAGADPRM